MALQEPVDALPAHCPHRSKASEGERVLGARLIGLDVVLLLKNLPGPCTDSHSGIQTGAAAQVRGHRAFACCSALQRLGPSLLRFCSLVRYGNPAGWIEGGAAAARRDYRPVPRLQRPSSARLWLERRTWRAALRGEDGASWRWCRARRACRQCTAAGVPPLAGPPASARSERRAEEMAVREGKGEGSAGAEQRRRREEPRTGAVQGSEGWGHEKEGGERQRGRPRTGGRRG